MNWICAMDNLRLRRFHDDDFAAFHALVSDYEVAKMLVIWPHPSEPEFTRARMDASEAKTGQVLVIEVEGVFAGSVGTMFGGLGYMLARDYWGRGIASWAVAEMLKRMFEGTTLEETTACVWHDNPASEKVLANNGFRMVGVCEGFCKARGMKLENNSLRLSRANWARAQPFYLKTERLIIEPFTGDEAAAFSALMNDPDIARMMTTIAHPFTPEDAATWLSERPFIHEIGEEKGFGAKICLHDGTLIGFVGIGGAPANTAYAFGRAYWGRGYATEAMRAFLEHCTRIFALKEITAGAMFDNPASAAVLRKLGFEPDGEMQHKASGRLEKAPLFLYRKINH
ncbi:MAG: GNAT family N-acetyltransferase [Rhodobacteraceae bacterium]|nr:GNAT family N-acetyltransferase [Paracoccaceae bacterium]